MRIYLILLSALLLAPLGAVGSASPVQANSSSDNDSQATNEPLLKPVFIDFETMLVNGVESTLTAGSYITGDEWAGYGVTITAESNRKRKLDGETLLPLRLFDSDCRPKGVTDPTYQALPICSGGDHDLATGDYFGTESQGNVLIIQEDNSKKRDRDNLGTPDDDARGGKMIFDFVNAVTDITLGFLDFDDRDRGEGYIKLFTDADDENPVIFNLSDIPILNAQFQGDNSMRIIQGGEIAFKRMEVEYPGSGAITHLCYVPEVAPGGSKNWADSPESCRW
ncbi:MAG: hypothetical protein AAGF98_10755 [Cyanobacteria bacterium P01_H01_bin.153]